MERRFYQFYQSDGLGELVGLEYVAVRTGAVRLKCHPKQAVMIDYRKVWSVEKSLALNGLETWLMVFNAAGQLLQKTILIERVSLPSATAWVLILPEGMSRRSDIRAIGAWSYQDKISAVPASAIEYQWRCHPQLSKLRFKVLKRGYANFSLSPDFFDFVNQETFYRKEEDRIPLFIASMGITSPEAYAEIRSYPGRLFGVLSKSSFSGRVHSIRLYTGDGIRLATPSIPNECKVEIRNYLDLGDLPLGQEGAEESLKEAIWQRFEDLEFALAQHFGHWKIYGGGTTGYAIASVQKRIAELKVFFRKYG